MRAVSDSVWWVSAAVGYLQVNSENGVGYCVPTNGSVDEVIAGLARASASAAAGVSGDHTVAIQPQIDTHGKPIWQSLVHLACTYNSAQMESFCAHAGSNASKTQQKTNCYS